MPPPLLPLDAVAEERIQEAMRRGDFDNLPGAGRPLLLDDDPLVPAEVRAAHRILKNAGLVPVEILERREIADLETRLPSLKDDSERSRVLSRLALLRLRLGPRRAGRLARNACYECRIMEKLGGG
jgi:DnaJ homologue, subfamily C, member 28, conserved domain